ncbi:MULTISPECIES: hypothetical protein [unclassified Mesotoga]|jgi:hypothetical protein|uniref:hypothetical protein n=1 Tax=unclassified Mesotoga TaxID=1184398 RepID=UPI000C1A861B|nr:MULTISPECIES: hypothetical protein [unclassified Mesotoga]PVD17494.1 hypothetical protein V512_011345 [Mesotoga sp. Brook.08.105.5.1]RAO96455.1 hypothetical protein M388_14450 [Mesotoga sp. Brook.08.YT.4.2.5.4.]
MREKEREIVKRQIRELLSESAKPYIDKRADMILESNLLKDEEISELIQEGRAYTMAIALINDWLLTLPYPLKGKAYKKLKKVLDSLMTHQNNG